MSQNLSRGRRHAWDIDPSGIYYDRLSGQKDKRPGLDACLKALRSGDTAVVVHRVLLVSVSCCSTSQTPN
ncbi:recombinase family protein, partial [Thiolapillus sp.]